jgi:hypothetical protein
VLNIPPTIEYPHDLHRIFGDPKQNRDATFKSNNPQLWVPIRDGITSLGSSRESTTGGFNTLNVPRRRVIAETALKVSV